MQGGFQVSAGALALAAAALAGCATADGRGATSAACDRACLTQTMTTYLDALVAGEPGRLAVAENVRFTEDGVDTPLGEGLWADAPTLTGYRFDIVDAQAGVAATLVKLDDAGMPTLLALRLKVEDRKITEIETMVVHNQAEGMIFRTDAITTLSPAMAMTPPADELESRQDAIAIAEHYPHGLQAGSFVTVDAPFADDAYRFENGQLMAGPGCTFFAGCDAIKTQTIPTLAQLKFHIAAVDEEQGVVLIRMDFGPGSTFSSADSAPTSLSVFEAFKVYGGQIHAVEAFMRTKPADAPLGWEPPEGGH